MQQMKSGMDGNAQQMEKKMDGMENKMDTNTNKMEEMRGEMQNMGRGLQAGIKAIVCSETQTARKKIAAPCAGTSELGGVQWLSGPRWRRVRTG